MDTSNTFRRCAALLLACASVGSATAAVTTPVKLIAEVGPGSNITLKKGTARVTSLKAGIYLITVNDRSSHHNFRLVGPGGVNRSTSVSSVTTTTWKVTLRAGTYQYQCDPHRAFMRGSFAVTR